MGQDKALRPFLGRPLIDRVVDRLAPAADELLISTNRPDLFGGLGGRLVEDFFPGLGPLGGLLSAFPAASHPLVAVVACDMPFVSPDLLLAQKQLLCREEVDAVVPRLARGYEPLHGVYRRDPCLEKCRQQVERGDLRMQAWLQLLRLRAMQESEIVPIDLGLLSFKNVNLPEEFTEAERLARTIEGGIS